MNIHVLLQLHDLHFNFETFLVGTPRIRSYPLPLKIFCCDKVMFIIRNHTTCFFVGGDTTPNPLLVDRESFNRHGDIAIS